MSKKKKIQKIDEQRLLIISMLIGDIMIIQSYEYFDLTNLTFIVCYKQKPKSIQGPTNNSYFPFFSPQCISTGKISFDSFLFYGSQGSDILKKMVPHYEMDPTLFVEQM